jgi:hypothetical protein
LTLVRDVNRYVPTQGLPEPLAEEADRIAERLARPSVEFLELTELQAPPAKLFTGLTVLADGTNWNPGAGAGVYTYYGGVWNRLG